MIEFSKITKTLDGYECHYFGTRIGADQKILHCFAVWTHNGVFEKCYDEHGRHLVWDFGTWEVSKTDAFAITKPPKIVEVTRWVALYSGKTIGDGHFVCCYEKKPELQKDTLDIQQHTFRFEVPNV